jgi:hypothetical protein
MPDLSDPTLRQRLMAELEHRWLRQAAPGGIAMPALQTEGDGGFGTGRNADAAALFTLPPAWNADPAPGRGLLDFVMAMGPGEVLWRGWASPGLEVRSADPCGFAVQTSQYRFTGDLSRGLVEQAPRRGGTAMRHTGNMVEFRLGGRSHCLDVEDAVTGFGLEESEEGVRLFHESTLTARTGFPRRHEVAVGTVLYEYRIAADSPLLRLAVTFRAAAALHDLRLTTALDGLSEPPDGPGFRRVVLGAAGGFRGLGAIADGTATLAEEPLDYLSMAQPAAEGPVQALHLRPVPGEGAPRLSSVKAVGQQGGRLHWVVLRHARKGPLPAGTEVALREDRLLTFGAAHVPPAASLALLRNPEEGGADPSASEAAGPALEAAAQHFLLSVAGAYAAPPAVDRLTLLRAWVDRRLGLMLEALGEPPEAARTGPRELGFTLLTLDCMHRATGLSRYRARSRALTGLLLSMQRPDGAFATPGTAPTLEGQAAALLALSRLLLQEATPVEETVTHALSAGLSALRLGTVELAEGRLLDTLVVLGAPAGDGAVATASLALALRALTMVEEASRRGVAGLPTEAAGRLPLLRHVVLERLEEVLCAGTHGLAAAASAFEAEPDAGATAALALALAGPDAAVLGCRAAMQLAATA